MFLPSRYTVLCIVLASFLCEICVTSSTVEQTACAVEEKPHVSPHNKITPFAHPLHHKASASGQRHRGKFLGDEGAALVHLAHPNASFIHGEKSFYQLAKVDSCDAGVVDVQLLAVKLEICSDHIHRKTESAMCQLNASLTYQ